jgi:hypothetical protein
VIYWVHSFGTNNSAGPGEGWNTTTIRDASTTVLIDQVLYSRQFDLQVLLSLRLLNPKPSLFLLCVCPQL